MATGRGRTPSLHPGRSHGRDNANQQIPGGVLGASTTAQLIRAGLGALVIVLLLVVGRSLAAFIPAVTIRIQHFGALAPIVFIFVYALAEIAFVPGGLLTLAGGALFGVIRGTVFAMIGATLGAVAAFLVARYAIRRFVKQRIEASPRFNALDAAIGGEGRKIVFLLRLTPLIPFNALNYALGVTRVRLVDYVIGSAGMLPGALLYAYYGHVVGDVARLASGASPPRGTAYYVFLAIGLLATIALTVILSRIARRALAASTATVPW